MATDPRLVPAQRRPSEPRGLGSLAFARVTSRADAARREVEAWPEARVDGLLAALAQLVVAEAAVLGALAAEETGVGDPTDKALRTRSVALAVPVSLRGVGRPGGHDPRRGLTRAAAPVGVVLAVLPATDPVAGLVVAALLALKGRNALVVSPHPRARRVSLRTTAMLRGVLADRGAPQDLLQCLDGRGGRERVADLVRAPQVALVLASGTPELLKAARTGDTPVVAVGLGNTPVWVADDADLSRAARDVVQGKGLDHGVVCGAEQHLVVSDRTAAGLLAALDEHGAAVLSQEQVRQVERTLLDPSTRRLRRDVVGQSAPAVAAAARVRVPPRTRLLVAPLPDDGLHGPWAVAQPAPLVTLRTAPDASSALALCRALLEDSGPGATAVVRTRSRRLARTAAAALPAARVLVDEPAGCGDPLLRDLLGGWAVEQRPRSRLALLLRRPRR